MSHPASSPSFTLPDTLRNWPWPRALNPHYDACKVESSEWCESFRAFTPKAQKAFDRCDFNLLACLVWPQIGKAGARIGCDLMNLFFIIDEYTDVSNGVEAQAQIDIIMDAINNPYKPRPEGEWIVGEITRQFWLNAIKTSPPSWHQRFITTFESCMSAVVLEATDRASHHIRSIPSYFRIRRETIGTIPSFALIGVDLDISHEILLQPSIQTLTNLATDMIIIANDICSYNVEQARGDDLHNLITIVMHEKSLNLHSALAWISALHDTLLNEFLSTYTHLPSALLTNPEVMTYIEGLGYFVRGADCWCFESGRYFDKLGVEIQRSRKVELMSNNIQKGQQVGNTGLVIKPEV